MEGEKHEGGEQAGFGEGAQPLRVRVDILAGGVAGQGERAGGRRSGGNDSGAPEDGGEPEEDLDDLGDKYSDVCVLDSVAEVSQCLRLRMKAQDLQACFTSIRLQHAPSALHLPK